MCGYMLLEIFDGIEELGRTLFVVDQTWVQEHNVDSGDVWEHTIDLDVDDLISPHHKSKDESKYLKKIIRSMTTATRPGRYKLRELTFHLFTINKTFIGKETHLVYWEIIDAIA